MKGLLLKDWYVARKYCKAFLVIVIVFLASSFFVGDDNLFLVSYPVLFGGLIPMTLLSYDERFHWQLYSGILPITRKQIVTCKYLDGLIGQGAMWILTACVMFASVAVNHRIDAKKIFPFLLAIATIALISFALTMPLLFRFGVEKGRLIYFVAVIIICIGALSIDGGFGTDMAPTGYGTTLLILFPAAVILYVLSWMISVKAFEKRELN